MSLSITPENKNDLTITNQNKDYGMTWNEATFTWDEAVGTWDVPGLVIVEESKNSISISNESKT